MVKEKYKTYEELGITFAEWGALWGFKAIAEAGIVLKHVPAKAQSPWILMREYPGVHFFDMGMTCKIDGCGSVACIGGTVGMLCQMPDPGGYVNNIGDNSNRERSTLEPLYFPKWNNGHDVRLKNKDDGFGWEKITPKMAAAAVDNFLRTGKPNWNGVIPTILTQRGNRRGRNRAGRVTARHEGECND